MEEKKTRKRTKNFTESEIKILIEEVERRRYVLFGPLKGPNLTQQHRDRAWGAVAMAVNAVAPANRQISELQHKVRDLKSRVKSKANAVFREHKKTGGGTNDAPSLDPTEEKVLQFIGPESVQGIAGGIDTFRQNVQNEPTLASAPPQRLPSPSIPLPIPEMEIIPPPPDYHDLPLYLDSNETSSFIEPEPIPGPSRKSPPPVPLVTPKKNNRKRSAKKAALDELEKNTAAQERGNQLMCQLLTSVDTFNQNFSQFLELKRREVELLEKKLSGIRSMILLLYLKIFIVVIKCYFVIVIKCFSVF